jgi:hypothetical protein
VQMLRIFSQAGEDGILHLEIPVDAPNGEFEVVVVLQPKAPETRPPTSKASGWPPGFIEETAGSIQDETFKRHDQGEFEKRLDF